MKIRLSLRAGRAGLVLLGCVLFACQRPTDSVRVGGSSFPAPPVAGTAIVCGTVFDLKTGAPAADVAVSFAGGKAAHTDAQGRFEIQGLELGASGEVLARSSDGREGTVKLLPLGSERREIVLNLAAR
jgi:hypothetical protein